MENFQQLLTALAVNVTTFTELTAFMVNEIVNGTVFNGILQY